MTQYTINAPLAVHTAWLDPATKDSPTTCVYVVNTTRRRAVPIGLFCVLTLTAIGIFFPAASIYCGAASVALVVLAFKFANGGGTGFYSVGADGIVQDKISKDLVETSGLTRVRVRWI